jgi:hypothetical protein
MRRGRREEVSPKMALYILAVGRGRAARPMGLIRARTLEYALWWLPDELWDFSLVNRRHASARLRRWLLEQRPDEAEKHRRLERVRVERRKKLGQAPRKQRWHWVTEAA